MSPRLTILLLLLILGSSSCAYRSIETPTGIRYTSLHLLQQQDIATLDAAVGEASFSLQGYHHTPDSETATAITEGAARAIKP